MALGPKNSLFVNYRIDAFHSIASTRLHSYASGRAQSASGRR